MTEREEYYLDAEIIETYWNVNDKLKSLHGVSIVEIIETYWNVNSFSISFAIFCAVK